MATKPATRGKRPGKSTKVPTSTLLAQNEKLAREVSELRKENRQLKRSLGALMCKDLPVNMELTPDDGMSEPSLTALIAEMERAGK